MLCLIMALATAGRAAHPIFAYGLHTVVRGRKLHPPDVLLVDSIRGEVLDQPPIQRVVWIERKAPAWCAVAGICLSADVTKIRGGGDGSDLADVATAAKVAVLAIPRHRTRSSWVRHIDAVRRQADTDPDLLALTGQVSSRRTRFTREREIDFTVWRVRRTRELQNRREPADLRISREAVSGIGSKLRARRQRGRCPGRDHEDQADNCAKH